MNENIWNGTDIVLINIDSIILGDRIRSVHDDERLKNLKASIEKEGLLQPIIINQDNKLIAGYRRYTSCKELGHTRIQAKRITTKDNLHERLIEIKENVDRKAFTFSEKMWAAKTIEPVIREFAEQRIKKKKETDLSRFGIVAKRGKTRDIMAEILGIGSGKTYDKAKYVWESRDEETISLLDENKLTISRAYNRTRHKHKLATETGAANSVIAGATGAAGLAEQAAGATDNIALSVENILLDLGTRIDNNDYDYDELKKARNILVLIQEKIEDQLEKKSIEYRMKQKWQQDS